MKKVLVYGFLKNVVHKSTKIKLIAEIHRVVRKNFVDMSYFDCEREGCMMKVMSVLLHLKLVVYEVH